MCLKTVLQRHWRILATDTRRAVLPFVLTPGQAFGFLSLTFVLAIFPHEANNSFRKLITFIMFVTWIVITVGVAFNEATINPWLWGGISSIITLVFGQMWGIEISRVALSPDGIEFNTPPDDND